MIPLRPRSRKFRNREGDPRFDFRLPLQNEEPGVSAMVRVKDEAGKIEHCLRSIIPVFDEIHVLDNASADDTAEIVASVQDRFDPEGKVRLHSYPHRLQRFGPENSRTPADSLHSAVYFTNWSMSRCTRRYVCKWDGDMVLVRAQRAAFEDLLDGLKEGPIGLWSLAGQTVYRGLDGAFYAAREEVNRELEIFPCSYRCKFRKKEHWEKLTRPWWVKTFDFAPTCFWELKFTDEDEFDHWSTTDFPSERKRREWRNFHRVRDSDTVDGFETYPSTFLDDEIASR